MSTIEIPILLGEKTVNGSQLAVGTVRISDLINKYEIHTYNRDKGEMGTKAGGYQREASQYRVKAIAKSLISEKIDIPTAIICNIRDFDKSDLKKSGNSTILKVDSSKAKNKFFVIDGQHRTKGLEEVLEDSETAALWKDKLIFAVFYLGGEFSEEKEAFYYINTTAKSIPTGSKLELKLGIEDDVPEEEKNAVVLTRKMADESKIWQGLIKYPNSKIGILPNSSFITSLKHLYQQDWFLPKSLEDQFKLLDAFWRGVAKVLPVCFKEPEKYTIQRAVGVTVLHNVMGITYQKLILQGRDIFNSDDWAEFLTPLATHQDTDRTAEANPVKGADFWLSGSAGAAGKYSSGAGRTNLIALFRGKLT